MTHETKMKYWQADISVFIQADTEEEAQIFLERAKNSLPNEETEDKPGIYMYAATQIYEDEDK